MRPAALLAVALAVPQLAGAWETKKFNGKAIQKEWKLPAYDRGGVVGNEVTVNAEERTRSAEWALKKADIKAVADFYKAKLKIDPKNKTTDTGDELYDFALPVDKQQRIARHVYVKFDNNDRLVHVRFAEKKYLDIEELPTND